MKILIGCDVDPVLPEVLSRRPDSDPWRTLGRIDDLLQAAGSALPVLTWLIRADESVRFSTGDFASGYLARRGLWERLRRRGHELGWHMHLMSMDARSGVFRFDSEPAWLAQARDSLSRHFPVEASRTGWDYGSNRLFKSLDALGVRVDFSALPGNRTWFRMGGDRIDVDWLRCSPKPYHPDAYDYQRPGENPLDLIEAPIAQFPNGLVGMAGRGIRRLRRGCISTAGMSNKTRLMTQPWPTPPKLESEIPAFFFHPDELTDNGIRNFLRNVDFLRNLPGAEFINASEVPRLDGARI